MSEELHERAAHPVFADGPSTGAAVTERPEHDLESPADVAHMVRRFYADVDVDDLLGPMFNDVAQVDWASHLPKLTAFWCRALFGIQGYVGNPFRAHLLIHHQRPFTDAHFQRWLSLFHRTVDEGWAGPNAEAVKGMARNVAAVHSRNLATRPAPTGPSGRTTLQVTIENRAPQEAND